ncbi:MAG: hypothetical protein K2X44_04050, partial [Magnetospirillum sp.]|nr:hypothetical protein [Magnetospirillum sp.]
MTLRPWPMVFAAGICIAAATALIAGSAATPPRPQAGADFIQQRCRLLEHHRHQLDMLADEIAEAELAPAFRAMDGRMDAFGDWAFRWRTSYGLLRQGAFSTVSAISQGQSIPARLRSERDAFVGEAFERLVVAGDDQALATAA